MEYQITLNITTDEGFAFEDYTLEDLIASGNYEIVEVKPKGGDSES